MKSKGKGSAVEASRGSYGEGGFRSLDRTSAALAFAGSAVSPQTLRFPLFWRGVERTKFEIAVRYLSLDVDQLLAARNACCASTRSNLGVMDCASVSHRHRQSFEGGLGGSLSEGAGFGSGSKGKQRETPDMLLSKLKMLYEAEL